MNRTIVGMTTAVGALLTATVVSATPAAAATCYDFDDTHAPVVNSVSVSPGAITVQSGLSSAVVVSVHVTDPVALEDCDYDTLLNDSYASGTWWVPTRIDFMSGSGGGYVSSDTEDAVLTSGTIYDGVWQATYYLTTAHKYGSWSVDVTAYDNGVNKVERPDTGVFSVAAAPVVVPTPTPTPTPTPAAPPAKRTTYLSVNASPEPAEKGATIKAKAKLRTSAGPLAGRAVSFYFRAKGSSTWSLRARGTTNSLGLVVKRFTARKTGDWQVRYAGSSTHTPDRAIDTVKVVA